MVGSCFKGWERQKKIAELWRSAMSSLLTNPLGRDQEANPWGSSAPEALRWAAQPQLRPIKRTPRPAFAMRLAPKPVGPGQGRGAFWAGLICASLLVGVSVMALRGQGRSSAAPAGERRAASAFKPIEAIRVGDRVVTNWQEAKAPASAVDPATWRRVSILAWASWSDVERDDIHIETLLPPEWLEANNVQVGAEVQLPLDLVEMGLPDDLRGEVVGIAPCPPIKPGAGRVVLTTVNHLNASVRELKVEDSHGRCQTIRPTDTHKIYRATDGKWVAAAELRVGDLLRGREGLLRVLANAPVPGLHRVYNLTVEGEHVYRVSAHGVLVHNTCPRGPQMVGGRKKHGKGGAEHKKRKRPSTTETHEQGQSTKRRSKGGEKGDDRRPYQR
jgi:hypothetical protein